MSTSDNCATDDIKVHEVNRKVYLACLVALLLLPVAIFGFYALDPDLFASLVELVSSKLAAMLALTKL